MYNHKSDIEKHFNVLFEEYYNAIKYYAYGILKNEEDALEVAQNVFMQLWQNIDSIEFDNNIAGWLFLSAKWKCYRVLDKRKHTLLYKNSKKTDSKIDIVIARNSNIHTVWSSEVAEIIRKTLASLPPKTAEVFIMNKFCNFSQQQIAEHQNCSIKNIEYRMAYAVKALKEALKDYWPIILGILSFHL